MSPIGHNITAFSMATAYMGINGISWFQGLTSLRNLLIQNTFGVINDIALSTFVALGIILGARRPDRLEIPSLNKKTKIRRSLIPHRTLTHWPLFWVVITFLNWVLARQNNDIFISATTSVGFGFCASSWLHLAMDIMTPSGIPLLTPFGSRTSLNIYKSGHFGEMAFVSLLLFITIIFVLHF
jgi:membrane-bound metal-dependent hydrolase YbcI (DUF457 family)